MTFIERANAPDACGVVTGRVVTNRSVAAFDPLLDRARAVWTAGDFGRIAAGYAGGAEEFVARLAPAVGEAVLDVACGTGNLAIPAARLGARVTGVDIAPNLVDEACAAAAEASLDIRFEVGAAESLPYADGAFDTVVSMFGVMFSGRPEAALAELVRVTRPGGRIALANWTPGGFAGAMLRAHAAHLPPPPGAPGLATWGEESVVRERLEPHAARIGEVRFAQRTVVFCFPLTPAGVVELFREFYGPSVRTFGALDAEGRASLSAVLLDLWHGRNRAAPGGTLVDAEYLEVTIDVA